MTFTGPKVGSVTKNVNMIIAVKDHGVSSALQQIVAGAADEAEREAHLWKQLGFFTLQDEKRCSLKS